jgi:hypothetical protein
VDGEAAGERRLAEGGVFAAQEGQERRPAQFARPHFWYGQIRSLATLHF